MLVLLGNSIFSPVVWLTIQTPLLQSCLFIMAFRKHLLYSIPSVSQSSCFDNTLFFYTGLFRHIPQFMNSQFTRFEGNIQRLTQLLSCQKVIYIYFLFWRALPIQLNLA